MRYLPSLCFWVFQLTRRNVQQSSVPMVGCLWLPAWSSRSHLWITSTVTGRRRERERKTYHFDFSFIYGLVFKSNLNKYFFDLFTERKSVSFLGYSWNWQNGNLLLFPYKAMLIAVKWKNTSLFFFFFGGGEVKVFCKKPVCQCFAVFYLENRGFIQLVYIFTVKMKNMVRKHWELIDFGRVCSHSFHSSE